MKCRLIHASFSIVMVSSLSISSCKTSKGSDSRISKEVSKTDTKPSELFDVNDVSILYPMLGEDRDHKDYIHLNEKTAEGVILAEAIFLESAKLVNMNVQKFKYADFVVSGVRIDNCAKLILEMPCVPQIRLVVQNAEDQDQTLHLPFNVPADKAMTFYQEFLDLKLSAQPTSTRGMLGTHPVLAKEGLQGPFAKRLRTLVAKYSLASHMERVALMSTKVKGSNGEWNFAATQPIKDGKVLATPIPCLNGKTQNIINISSITGFTGQVVVNTKFNEPVQNCGNLDATPIIVQSSMRRLVLKDEADKPKVIHDALAINDPSKVFFASTTCVNCHLASRRLGMYEGQEFLTAKDGHPARFEAPSDVTSEFREAISAGGDNSWNIRAFGWNETSGDPSITLYTLNDTMRVAHELNNLIREGQLK